jgi:hypothetical protein
MEPMALRLASSYDVVPLGQHPGTELPQILEGRKMYGEVGVEYQAEPGHALRFGAEAACGPAQHTSFPSGSCR